ncbi:hypothetical protein [Legionella fallonii]|uniref:Uncharacterized protein n=1 Tax=Legionella fallonii LLAP-10 TaxID=1212491 RepID=A0A098FZI0_9GAMM|nr:hypothetical protein [Legionella fallonii]CEG55632.1 protein of unknown function [Legionella fallonii LLAP-10]
MSKIKRILAAAIRHVRHICILGSSNKSSDMEKTNGWVFFPQFRYNYSGRYVKKKDKWIFSSDDPMATLAVDLKYTVKYPGVDPFIDPQFALEEQHKDVLLLALLAGEKRMGNCHTRCCVLAKYLWENNYPEIQRIELLSFNFDHFVVVVNRTGDIDDPKTWGNALIVESWYPAQGAIYSPQEFMQQAQIVRKFIKSDLLKQYKLGLPGREELLMGTDWEHLSWECYAAIDPNQHRYPTYSRSPFRPIEYYYEPKYTYTAEISDNRKNVHPLLGDRLIHQARLNECFAELNTAEETSLPTPSVV